MTSALITRTEPEKSTIAATPKRRQIGCVAAALFCGLFAFTLAVLDNIVLSDAASRQIFDSCHYIQTARELYLCVQDLLLKTNVSVEKETLGSMLLIDGPILPICGAITSAVFGCGTAPSVATANVLMLFQAAMHALSASLVVALANSWLRSTRIYLSMLAGILWAAYPGALAGSGMFLTETLTTTLVLTLVWLSLRPATSALFLTNAALGFTIACMALLKPPLLPLVGGLLILRFATHRRMRLVPALLAMFAGLVIVMAPWMAFTKFTTGKAQILPQRVPSVNLAVGNDVEFDGWHALPLPPLTMLEILQAPPQIVSSLVRAHGAELVPMTFRKFSRLWAQPWIPSQRSVLGLPYALQCSTHQLLIALSLPAILFALSMTRLSRQLPRRRLLSTALCLVLFTHLLYLPFETVARYALPAMPALLVLCVCATAEMLRRRSLRIATAVGITCALAIALTWQIDLFPLLSSIISNSTITSLVTPFIAVALFLSMLFVAWRHAAGRVATHKIRLAAALMIVGLLACGVAFATVEPSVALPEWKTELRSTTTAPSTSAVRTIESVPHIDWTRVAGAYVLVDADKNIESAEITVNGVLAGHPGRAHEVCDYAYKSTVDEFLAICAKCRNLQPEDMRNWWLAPIEIEKLTNQNGPVELKVTAKQNKQPVTVYGHYVRDGQKELLIPHLHYLGFSKLEASRDRLEYRHTDKFHGRTTKAVSRLQGTNRAEDLSTQPGTQTGEYRIYLLIAYKLPAEVASSQDETAWLYPDHQLWSIW